MVSLRISKWLGPQEKCQLCNGWLRSGKYFYDCKLRGRTSWALICEGCFSDNGAGLGVGIGQQYDSLTSVKTAG